MSPPSDLTDRLSREGQQHVLRWWHELSSSGQKRLSSDLEGVDLGRIRRLLAGQSAAGQTAARHERTAANDARIDGDGSSHTAATDGDPVELSRRAMPPSDLIQRPHTSIGHERHRQAAETGRDLLRAGRIGVILVAGGQGTRLGFPHPKGMFPIGPVTGASLYQVLAEQVLARSRQAGTAIPYFVMTSEATHDETTAFFRQHNWFGLPRQDVFFFEQGAMPAVDAATGRLLLAGKDRLALSPDGHGGLVAALARAELFDAMHRRGVEHLFYHQVDNPTVNVCDPAFLGFHAQRESELSTKVVAKRSWDEPMGVLVSVDGVTRIIEYSDLPDDVAQRTEETTGRLAHWAGSTAIHVFNRSLLERLAEDDDGLPFHVAHKIVPYLDETGRRVEPECPNAYKFERFIFDALPHARRALVFEADREREFNPVKNHSGPDSPETARAALMRLHAAWLREAGVELDEKTIVELSPLFALDAEDVRKRLSPGRITAERVFFG